MNQGAFTLGHALLDIAFLWADVDLYCIHWFRGRPPIVDIRAVLGIILSNINLAPDNLL